MSDFLPKMDTLIGLLYLIAGFGFIIFVHELGHFMVAKWVGIKVTQFAIGFGSAIVTWRQGIGFRAGTTEPEYEKRLADGADPASLGETEYRLNYVPLGGYVKMLGQEDLDPSARSDDPRSYNSKPVWARMCVISAGVVMNLIFAIIFFVIAFNTGVAFPPAVVGLTDPGLPAATTNARGHEDDPAYRGLQPDDHITHIDGKPTLDFTDVLLASALGREDQSIELTIERAGHSDPLTYVMTPRKLDKKLLALGIVPPTSLELVDDPKQLAQVLVEAGVEPGMRIVAVDGQAVQRYEQYRRTVIEARGQPVVVTFTKGAATATAPLRARPLFTLSEEHKVIHLLGWVRAASVDAVTADSPAEQAGIQHGDVWARIGAIDWPTESEVRNTIKQAGRRAVDVSVLRDDQIVNLGPVKPDRDSMIGISFNDIAVVADTLDDCPAAVLNLPPGSRIIGVNDKRISSFADLQRALQKQLSGEGPAVVRMTCRVNIAEFPTETHEVSISAEQARAIAGAGWTEPFLLLKRVEVPLIGDNPLDAVVIGLKKTQQTMTATYLTIVRLAQGRVPPHEIRGPIGIADIGTQIYVERGTTYLLFFLGLISVNLAVINFLPIPVVDGGHMVFLVIEKLKGSPASARIQTTATIVGLALIGSLVLLVTFNDILRIFTEQP